MDKRGEEDSTEGWKMIITIALVILVTLILAGATYKIVSVITR